MYIRGMVKDSNEIKYYYSYMSEQMQKNRKYEELKKHFEKYRLGMISKWDLKFAIGLWQRYPFVNGIEYVPVRSGK